MKKFWNRLKKSILNHHRFLSVQQNGNRFGVNELRNGDYCFDCDNLVLCKLKTGEIVHFCEEIPGAEKYMKYMEKCQNFKKIPEEGNKKRG